MDESATTESRTKASLRRPKPQLSCKLCRSRKLKCDREHPCKNCAKLPSGSCVYVTALTASEKSGVGSNSQQKRGQSATGKLQNRIQRLEQLVASLAEASGPISANDDNEDHSHGVEAPIAPSAPEEVPESDRQIANPTPRLSLNDTEHRFINSSHWEAILADIACIKDELVSNRSSIVDDESDPYTEGNDSVGPQLLFMAHRDISVEELICSVPPASVVMTLVRLLTENTDIPPLLTLLHPPTFIRQCEEYMDNPEAVALPWLSLLFAVMSLALQVVVRTGRKIEGVVLPESTARTYTMKSAQCLIASDYAKPTTYTVEAMHYWIEDGHFRGSLVFSTCLRLALRMGYHRDPSNYRGLSVFDSEMRRRTWGFMQQVDLMLAQKCGLPRCTNIEQSDTQPALHVLDCDIWPGMLAPPPERPETEQTPTGFMNYKNRLLAVLSRIVDRVNSSRNLSYEDVLELDKQLMAAAATRPAWLKPEPERANGESPHSELNRWVDADLILQRSRMVLHRKFLVPAHSNLRYSFSREVCLAAAETALRDQRKLFEESCAFDQTKASNWRFLALSGHDFLLAAIIICLDIDQSWRLNQKPSTGVTESDVRKAEFDKRVELIQASYGVWTGFMSQSPGSRKAAKILEIMLAKFRRDRGQSNTIPRAPNETQAPSVSPTQDEYNSSRLPNFSTSGSMSQPFDPQVQFGMHISNFSGTDNELGNFANVTPRSGSIALSEDPFQNMLDDPLMQMDWSAWDSEFQETGLNFY